MDCRPSSHCPVPAEARHHLLTMMYTCVNARCSYGRRSRVFFNASLIGINDVGLLPPSQFCILFPSAPPKTTTTTKNNNKKQLF